MHKSTVALRSKIDSRFDRPLLTLTLALLLLTRPLLSYGEEIATTDSPWRWSNINRVVVFADVHGAFPQLVSLLQANQLVDEALHWTGADTHLVSVGDLVDRGADSRQVLDLLMRLQAEAKASGGQVHVLAGNHELMNLIGDYRYVSKAEFAAFENEESVNQRKKAFNDYREQITLAAADQFLAGKIPATHERHQLRRQFNKKYPPGYFAYRQAFSAEGRYGQWLLSLPAVIVINDTVFTHGGLPELASKLNLKELNEGYQASVNEFLTLWRELVVGGLIPENITEDPVEVASEQLKLSKTGRQRHDLKTQTIEKLQAFMDVSHSPFLSAEGPLWYRGSVLCRDILERPILSAALANLGAKRVVVGHTVTRDAKVHEIHEGQLVMLDTGMLESVYHGRPASLLINAQDELSVQYINPIELTQPVIDNRIGHYGLTDNQLPDILNNGSISRLDKSNGIPWPVDIEYNNQRIQAVFYPSGKKGKASHELAAYRLDQLIGLDLIPPTVERRIDSVPGALQLRFKETLPESQRQSEKREFGGWCPMQRQFQLMYILDILSDNKGRSADNVLYDTKNWRLYVTGFKDAFSKRKKFGTVQSTIRLAPGVKKGLRSLTLEQLQDALGRWLSDKQIKALIARRDQMLDRLASSEF